MTSTIEGPQGRAPGLYDEQLQRQQQEKALFRDFAPNSGGGLLGRARRHAEPEAGAEGGKG